MFSQVIIRYGPSLNKRRVRSLPSIVCEEGSNNFQQCKREREEKKAQSHQTATLPHHIQAPNSVSRQRIKLDVVTRRHTYLLDYSETPNV